MRIRRIITIVLVGILLILAACAKPAPTTPAPSEPATPASPAPTPPPEQPVTPIPVTPPPVQPGVPPAPAGPRPDEVWAQNREFLPNILTVPVGTKITWINKDVDVHTVTSVTGLFDGNPGPGETFIYLFDKPGSYSYECGLHPGMAGKVVVQ